MGLKVILVSVNLKTNFKRCSSHSRTKTDIFLVESESEREPQKSPRKGRAPDYLSDVLRWHILLLCLDEPKLPLLPISLGVELLPLPRLLHQLRLQLPWRGRYAVRRLHRWRGRGHPRPRHHSWWRHRSRRRRRAAVPHLDLYPTQKSGAKGKRPRLPPLSGVSDWRRERALSKRGRRMGRKRGGVYGGTRGLFIDRAGPVGRGARSLLSESCSAISFVRLSCSKRESWREF